MKTVKTGLIYLAFGGRAHHLRELARLGGLS